MAMSLDYTTCLVQRTAQCKKQVKELKRPDVYSRGTKKHL